MNARENPPFDPLAKTAKEDAKTFDDAIFRFMSLEDRKRWMGSGLFNDLRVFQAGYYQKAHGHAGERESLSEGIFIYCIAGKGRFVHKSATWHITAGDLLYCFPRAHHRYEADEEDPWTIHWMHVSGSRMALYRKLIGLSPAKPVIKLGIHIEITDLFNSLYGLFGPSNDEARFEAIHACAQHILAMLAWVQRSSAARPQWEQQIHAAMAYMNQSVDRMLKLEDLSAYVGLSPFHFSRRFKSIVGTPPMKYFMRLKMKKACFLLESSSLKVKEIGKQLGFENEYYFSRSFKLCVGTSPRNYANGT
jgi:AraC-like DNA-binding protein